MKRYVGHSPANAIWRAPVVDADGNPFRKSRARLGLHDYSRVRKILDKHTIGEAEVLLGFSPDNGMRLKEYFKRIGMLHVYRDYAKRRSYE